MQPSNAPDGVDAADQEGPETIRLGALSIGSRLVIALAVALLVVFTAWHLTAAFFYVAPRNTVTEEYGSAIRGYINPEFEQNWKLFAPNPLQRNVNVQVRAEIRAGDGDRETTDWIDLTAQDYAHIRHNPLPSHAAQNQLRRAWDFRGNSHDDDGNPRGVRGEVSQAYVHRIALMRLGQRYDLDSVWRIQLRSATTRLPAPPWSAEDIDTTPFYDELDWYMVTTEDLPKGAMAPEEDQK